MPYNSIDHVPSIWDYLAQGVQQGYDVYRDIRNNRQEQDARRQAAALNSINMALEQNRQGNLPHTQVNQMIEQNANDLPAPLRGFRLNAPSPLELRSNIANTPDVNVAVPMNPMGGGVGPVSPLQVPGALKYSDAQLQVAGLPDRGQREMGALQQQGARLGIINSQLGIRQAEHNTSPEAFAMEDLKRKQETIMNLADNAVSDVLAKNGGLFRAAHGNLSKFVDQGFNNLKQTGALNVFGKIDPSTEQYIKSTMHSKLLDKQLEAYQAETGRISALNRGFGQQNAQLSLVDKMMDNIQQRINTVTGELNSLKGMPGSSLLMLPDSSLKKFNPELSDRKSKMNDLQAEANNLKMLQMKIADGSIKPENFAKLGQAVGGQVSPQGQIGAGAGQTPVAGAAGAQGGQAGAGDMSAQDFAKFQAQFSAMPRIQQEAIIRQGKATGALSANDIKKLGFKP